MNFQIVFAAFVSGIAAALGLGGGTVLIVYLTAFMGMGQTAAQGINLIFFIPVAALSLAVHAKNGLIDLKKLLPAIIAGVIFAVIGSKAANSFSPELLRKSFGLFLIIMGMKIITRTTKSSRLSRPQFADKKS